MISNRKARHASTTPSSHGQSVRQFDDQESFEMFSQVEDHLTKCLLLVAVLGSQGLTTEEESS